jgi:hypothetical protein
MAVGSSIQERSGEGEASISGAPGLGCFRPTSSMAHVEASVSMPADHCTRDRTCMRNGTGHLQTSHDLKIWPERQIHPRHGEAERPNHSG